MTRRVTLSSWQWVGCPRARDAWNWGLLCPLRRQNLASGKYSPHVTLSKQLHWNGDEIRALIICGGKLELMSSTSTELPFQWLFPPLLWRDKRDIWRMLTIKKKVWEENAGQARFVVEWEVTQYFYQPQLVMCWKQRKLKEVKRQLKIISPGN